MTLIAITNPSDESAESGFVATPDFICTPQIILEQYGDKLEDGAQVVMIEGEGEDTRVWQYVATRNPNYPESIALRSNNALAADAGPDGEEFIFYISGRDPYGEGIIENANVSLASDEPELETFTVFGNNDDGENFVAVVTATEETVIDEGVKAGVVDEGYESDVVIVAVLKGDQSHLERVAF